MRARTLVGIAAVVAAVAAACGGGGGDSTCRTAFEASALDWQELADMMDAIDEDDPRLQTRLPAESVDEMLAIIGRMEELEERFADLVEEGEDITAGWTDEQIEDLVASLTDAEIERRALYAYSLADAVADLWGLFEGWDTADDAAAAARRIADGLEDSPCPL